MGEPTTHTPLPPDLCLGFAGHMGLFGRCSGTSNSNAAALRMRSRRDAAVVVAAANVLGGGSHHSRRRLVSERSPCASVLCVSFLDARVDVDSDPPAPLSLGPASLGPLTSKNKPRGFPSAVSSFSGGVSTRMAFFVVSAGGPASKRGYHLHLRDTRWPKSSGEQLHSLAAESSVLERAHTQKADLDSCIRPCGRANFFFSGRTGDFCGGPFVFGTLAEADPSTSKHLPALP